MDGNKDDALKCLRIGKEALESGDQVRAQKFLSKARRLDPNLPIDELLSAAKGGESSDSPPPSNGANSPCKETGNQATASSSSSAEPSSAKPRARVSANGSGRTYTEEQITIVSEIKKEKDYYKILGLERNCSVEDVRKAYRKLSLKVHPDKNKAPGSDEAFKAVSKAFQCLSNEESRKRYDVVGSEEPNAGRQAARHNHGYNGFYEADFDPDEIFRNFFFGGGPMAATPFGTFQFRTGGMGGPNTRGMHDGGGFNLRTLIQILPVILLLLLNFLPSSDPVYSLYRTQLYSYKYETARGVPFYVKSTNFDEQYRPDAPARRILEEHIERDYLGVLSQNCRVELQRKHWGISDQTPGCDMLQKFGLTV